MCPLLHEITFIVFHALEKEDFVVHFKHIIIFWQVEGIKEQARNVADLPDDQFKAFLDNCVKHDKNIQRIVSRELNIDLQEGDNETETFVPSCGSGKKKKDLAGLRGKMFRTESPLSKDDFSSGRRKCRSENLSKDDYMRRKTVRSDATHSRDDYPGPRGRSADSLTRRERPTIVRNVKTINLTNGLSDIQTESGDLMGVVVDSKMTPDIYRHGDEAWNSAQKKLLKGLAPRNDKEKFMSFREGANYYPEHEKLHNLYKSQGAGKQANTTDDDDYNNDNNDDDDASGNVKLISAKMLSEDGNIQSSQKFQNNFHLGSMQPANTHIAYRPLKEISDSSDDSIPYADDTDSDEIKLDDHDRTTCEKHDKSPSEVLLQSVGKNNYGTIANKNTTKSGVYASLNTRDQSSEYAALLSSSNLSSHAGRKCIEMQDMEGKKASRVCNVDDGVQFSLIRTVGGRDSIERPEVVEQAKHVDSITRLAYDYNDKMECSNRSGPREEGFMTSFNQVCLCDQCTNVAAACNILLYFDKFSNKKMIYIDQYTNVDLEYD